MNYSELMALLKNTDQAFTAANGIGDNLPQWDAALEHAVILYNEQHGTSFNPVEARHQYIELQS